MFRAQRKSHVDRGLARAGPLERFSPRTRVSRTSTALHSGLRDAFHRPRPQVSSLPALPAFRSSAAYASFAAREPSTQPITMPSSSTAGMKMKWVAGMVRRGSRGTSTCRSTSSRSTFLSRQQDEDVHEQRDPDERVGRKDERRRRQLLLQLCRPAAARTLSPLRPDGCAEATSTAQQRQEAAGQTDESDVTSILQSEIRLVDLGARGLEPRSMSSSACRERRTPPGRTAPAPSSAAAASAARSSSGAASARCSPTSR